MHTGRSLTIVWGVPVWGCLPGGGCACLGDWCLPRGVCVLWLTYHAFDVTCMLPPHQLSVSTSAAAYIVWPRCMLGYTPLWTEWQTGAKILPCPRLHLRAVKMINWEGHIMFNLAKSRHFLLVAGIFKISPLHEFIFIIYFPYLFCLVYQPL